MKKKLCREIIRTIVKASLFAARLLQEKFMKFSTLWILFSLIPILRKIIDVFFIYTRLLRIYFKSKNTRILREAQSKFHCATSFNCNHLFSIFIHYQISIHNSKKIQSRIMSHERCRGLLLTREFVELAWSFSELSLNSMLSLHWEWKGIGRWGVFSLYVRCNRDEPTYIAKWKNRSSRFSPIHKSMRQVLCFVSLCASKFCGYSSLVALSNYIQLTSIKTTPTYLILGYDKKLSTGTMHPLKRAS